MAHSNIYHQYAHHVKEIGLVIKCILYKDGKALKGNVVTSIRVKDAKVTDVHKAIEEALFDETPSRNES